MATPIITSLGGKHCDNDTFDGMGEFLHVSKGRWKEFGLNPAAHQMGSADCASRFAGAAGAGEGPRLAAVLTMSRERKNSRRSSVCCWPGWNIASSVGRFSLSWINSWLILSDSRLSGLSSSARSLSGLTFSRFA